MDLPPGEYRDGTLPGNVVLGPGSVVSGPLAFKRFAARGERALVIGAQCTLDGATFALGRDGRMAIGAYAHVTHAVLLCEAAITIGSHVVIGWNATLMDADFHPLDAGERMADAIALSPAGAGRARPAFGRAPIVIEDAVWIGPLAAVLKGVHIGAGSVVEPGAVVTASVPPRSRVGGNPARILGTV
jgi:acetyltransferase-like isoleucine patch superfamily enzyme